MAKRKTAPKSKVSTKAVLAAGGIIFGGIVVIALLSPSKSYASTSSLNVFGGGSSAGGGATSPSTVLQRGSKGAAVTELQNFMRSNNPSALPRFGADGDFGAETEAELLKQWGKSSITYGELQTWKQQRTASVGTSVLTVPRETVLKRGSKGAAVTELQNFMRSNNPSALPRFGADGDFGAETEAELLKQWGSATITYGAFLDWRTFGVGQARVINGLSGYTLKNR